MAEPHVTTRAAKSSPGSNLPVRRIVIHATCGGRGFPRESADGVAAKTAAYFRSSSAGGSAHYICDIGGEEHTLPDAVVGWHAPPNGHSIGIEICADGGEDYGRFKGYTREQWLSPQVWPAVVRAARRTRELADRHDIPLRRLDVRQVRTGSAGICGHVDVSQAFRQTDHTDPGPAFPWDEFMDVVKNPDKPEELMLTIVSLGLDKEQTIASGGVAGLRWQTEYVDAGKLHTGDSPGILAKERCWCLASASVRLTGLRPGDQVALAWTRFSRDGKTVRDNAWTVDTLPADSRGQVRAEIGGQFGLDDQTQLWLQVLNPLAYPVVVADAMAKMTLLDR